jgi:NADH-quinone oxidoreductase subunit J
MELVLFYVAASVSLVATTLVITRLDASHALIYLIVSLLAMAVIFYLLGAPFAAALEVDLRRRHQRVLLRLRRHDAESRPSGCGTGTRVREPADVDRSHGADVAAVLRRWATRWPELDGVVRRRGLAKAIGTALYGPYVIAVELRVGHVARSARRAFRPALHALRREEAE